MGNNSKKSSDVGASRQERKAKKRKLEDAIPDVPGEENGDEIDVDNEDGGVKIEEGRETKRAKKDKNGKKDKKARSENKSKTEDADSKAGNENQTTATGGSEVLKDILGEEQGPKKSKKERKAERKAALAKEKATTGGADGDSETKAEQAVNGKKGDAQAGSDEKPARAQKANGTSTEQNKTQKNNQRRDQKRADKRAAAGGEHKDDRFIVFVGTSYLSLTPLFQFNHYIMLKPKLTITTQATSHSPQQPPP
jgi:nucleolar protein 6